MKSVYLLSLFYAKVADHKASFARISGIVSNVSNGDFKRIGDGQNHVAIAFTSDLPQKQLREQLDPIHHEGLTTLVTEVASVPGTTIAAAVLQWFHARLSSQK